MPRTLEFSFIFYHFLNAHLWKVTFVAGVGEKRLYALPLQGGVLCRQSSSRDSGALAFRDRHGVSPGLETAMKCDEMQ